jgi:hypothetical protein
MPRIRQQAWKQTLVQKAQNNTDQTIYCATQYINSTQIKQEIKTHKNTNTIKIGA